MRNAIISFFFGLLWTTVCYSVYVAPQAASVSVVDAAPTYVAEAPKSLATNRTTPATVKIDHLRSTTINSGSSTPSQSTFPINHSALRPNNCRIVRRRKLKSRKGNHLIGDVFIKFIFSYHRVTYMSDNWLCYEETPYTEADFKVSDPAKARKKAKKSWRQLKGEATRLYQKAAVLRLRNPEYPPAIARAVFAKAQKLHHRANVMKKALKESQPTARQQRLFRRELFRAQAKTCQQFIKAEMVSNVDEANELIQKVLSGDTNGTALRLLQKNQLGRIYIKHGLLQVAAKEEKVERPTNPRVVHHKVKQEETPVRVWTPLMRAAIVLVAPLMLGMSADAGTLVEVAYAGATTATILKMTLQNILNTPARKREAAQDGYNRYAEQSIKSAKSSEWDVFSLMRFSRSGKGGVNPNGKAHLTDKQKGRCVRIVQDSIGGAYCPKVKSFAKMLGIELGVDNCLRYEIDDQMDEVLKADVVEILMAARFIILCDGFAVHESIARPFIEYGEAMFENAVGVRSYFRSLVTTPSLYVVNEDLPIFLADLATLMGWVENDGGAVHTNRLSISMQFRGIAKVLEKKYHVLSKGISTGAKVIADITDGIDKPSFVNYEGDEPGHVKGEVRLSKKVDECIRVAVEEEFNALHAVNAATEQQLCLVHGIGIETAKKIIKARVDAGGRFTDMDAFYGVSKRLDPNNPDALKVLRWTFGHKERVYSVGLFLDKSTLKGADKNAWDFDKLNLFGINGQNVDFWAIAIDQIGGEISLGWQVVQLLDADFIGGLFQNLDGSYGIAAEKLAKQIDNAIEAEHPLVKKLINAIDDEGGEYEDLMPAVKAISVLQGLGKTASKRISNGLGAKAGSYYVQMIDMGGDWVIIKTPKAKDGKGFKRWAACFFGRTPNQGHETVRAPMALSPSYVGAFLRDYLKDGLEGVEKHGKQAEQFCMKLNINCGHDNDATRLRCRAILTMLPGVIDGIALVDSTLQQKVCGDNDGDRNMISFDKMLVSIAKHITRKHPATFPAREQSKKFVLNTFDDVVLEKGGWLRSFDEYMNTGDSSELLLVSKFLSAPGGTPGQGNVGGVTQCAAAPMLFCEWHWVKKGGKDVYEPVNPAARKLVNYLYLCQQIAIDRQKYYYLAPSLLFWFLADLTVGEAVIKQLKAGGHVDSKWLHSHYPIQGAADMSFEEYQQAWENGTLPEISEVIPGMGKGALGGESVAPMMYNNGPLYVHTAWQVNAINLGFGYFDEKMMTELSEFFDKETAQTANWGAIVKHLGLTISAEKLEEMWVWPSYITGWVGLNFRSNQDLAPETFQSARIHANNVWLEKMAKAGLNADPAVTLSESPLAEVLKEEAGDYAIEMKPWATRLLATTIYRSYVGESSNAVEAMSQSARTQTDHHASGADKLSFLRAALTSRDMNVEVADMSVMDKIKNLRFIWAKALQNDKMSDERRYQVLCAMMHFGICVIKDCLDDIENDKTSVIATNVIWALEDHTIADIAKLTTSEAWRAWRNENDADRSTAVAKERREAMDSVRKLMNKDGFYHWISEQNLSTLKAEDIATWLIMDGEESHSKIIDFIGSDFFGAIGEGWDRQELKESRNSVEEELNGALQHLKKIPVDDNFMDGVETYARDLIQWIRDDELEAQSGEKTDEAQMAWYSLNAREYEREVASITRPITSMIRLVKHQMRILVHNVNNGVNFEDEEAAFWPAIEGALFGTHKELNEETGEWEEVTHVESRIVYELPEQHLAEMNLAALEQGYDVEILVNMINGARNFYADDEGEIEYPSEPEEYYLTRKGYIHLSSIMTQMVLGTKSREDVLVWLLAQFKGGVGHVTTSQHLTMAYGPAEGRDHFWFVTLEQYPQFHNDLVVCEVQAAFEECYPERVAIEYFHDDDEETLDALECFGDPQNHSEDDAEYYENYYRERFEVELYLPPLFGGRSNWDELYDGKYSKFYDQQLVMTPYKMLRTYAFMMEGKDVSQMSLPTEVRDFQNDVFGYTVGDSKKQDKSQQSREADKRTGRKPKHTALKNNMTKKSCATWTWAGVEKPITSDLDVDFNGSDNLQESNNFCDISVRGYDNHQYDECWRGAYSLVRFTPSLLWSFANVMESGDFQEINARSIAKVGTSSVRRYCVGFRKANFTQMVKGVTVKSVEMNSTVVRALFDILANEEELEIGMDALGGPDRPFTVD
jgi:hypothetical protein